MFDTHTTHGGHTHHGPRFSASDRPLPPTEARTTSRARVRIPAVIAAVVLFMALGILAPTVTLTVLLAVVASGAVLWGVLHLADRGARSWGAAERLKRLTDHADPTP